MRQGMFAPLLLAALLAACAGVQPARMTLPSDLAGAETLVVSGIGAGQSGTLRAGPYAGSFARSDTRLAVFDPLYERRSGRTRVTVAGPGGETLAADCRAREVSVTVGVIGLAPRPMAFRCDLSGAASGRMELAASQDGVADMMMRQSRRGEIRLGDRVLEVRSVHDVGGSPIQTATPIGYLFLHGGRPVGAVEVNGAPVIRIAPTADAATRRSIVIGALALGVLWDPAESPLGREAG